MFSFSAKGDPARFLAQLPELPAPVLYSYYLTKLRRSLTFRVMLTAWERSIGEAGAPASRSRPAGGGG
jgi:hypothetical protein